MSNNLQGCPEIFCINLDSRKDRWEYMENQFKKYELDYHRVSAFNGSNSRFLENLSGGIPDNMTLKEVACTLSHLRALKQFLDKTDWEYVLIMEDDVDLSISESWPFTFEEYINNLPYDWEAVQLTVINPTEIHPNIHPRFINDFSTGVYLIQRDYATRLIRYHYNYYKNEEEYYINNGCKPRAVADDLIYNAGRVYAQPLFITNLDLGSDIHQEHIDAFHRKSMEYTKGFWKNTAPNIELDVLFNYDPYYGRMPTKYN